MRTGCGTAKVSSLGPQRPCAPQAFADPSASTGLPDRCSGRGCPCPRSRRRRPAEPWMAKRSRLSSERKAPEGRSERQASGMGSPGPRVASTSVARRLRDGKSLVACARKVRRRLRLRHPRCTGRSDCHTSAARRSFRDAMCPKCALGPASLLLGHKNLHRVNGEFTRRHARQIGLPHQR